MDRYVKLFENFNSFNPTGFIASIKDSLKKMGFDVKDMQGNSIDPYRTQLEKDAEAGKNQQL